MSKITIGSAPDSWGVWYADDPQQTPIARFLDEVVEAGYEWIEIGAFGYLPTEPARLRAELDARGLQVSGGTVFAGLHHHPGSVEDVWKQVAPVARLTSAMGAEHLVVIPDLWRDDLTGQEKEPRTLTAEQWNALTTGHDELGRRTLEEFGVRWQFHSHADSHIGYQADLERFLEATDPTYVNLCLDTGHIAYYGGDCVDLITRYPERIGYLHFKQLNPDRITKVLAEDISFSEAVRSDIWVEPPSGAPDFDEVIAAVRELPQDVFGVVEQDLYPCSPDRPLPIARRTYTYLRSCLGG
jgi:inosose dehydratase